MRLNKASSENLVKGAIAGSIGGLTGALAMELFQAGMKNLSGGSGSKGEPSTVIVAEKVAGGPLTDTQKQVGGEVVHYVFGAGSGAVYGLASELLPKSTLGWGTLFGGVLWLVADEIGVPVTGLSKSPDETPLSQHAAALAAHLVFGLTTDLVRRGVLTVLG